MHRHSRERRKKKNPSLMQFPASMDLIPSFLFQEEAAAIAASCADSFGNPSNRCRSDRCSSDLDLSSFHTAKRARCASIDLFFGEDEDEDDDDDLFGEIIRELKQICESYEDKEQEVSLDYSDEEADIDDALDSGTFRNSRTSGMADPMSPPIALEPSDRRSIGVSITPSVRTNYNDLPLSFCILKRTRQWQEGFTEAGESAYCSVNKAFASMVFIINKLERNMLQMREILFYEDHQGILVRVQKEMHASFVWLFQQIFSRTPTLMIYVMILFQQIFPLATASNGI